MFLLNENATGTCKSAHHTNENIQIDLKKKWNKERERVGEGRWRLSEKKRNERYIYLWSFTAIIRRVIENFQFIWDAAK